MFLSRLQLTQFRNFLQLDLALDQPFTVLQGPNGAGKTNLLDAICFLATSRSHKSQADSQSVHAGAASDALSFFEIAGTVVDDAGAVQNLRVFYGPRHAPGKESKILEGNGERLRALDLMGRLRAILFIPNDTRLIAEGPGVRRRALDITLCQIDRQYFRSLLRYQRILRERNALLKNLRADPVAVAPARLEEETAFWNRALARHGAQVMRARAQWLQLLAAQAAPYHAQMTQGQERLALTYRPSVRLPDADLTQADASVWESAFAGKLQETLPRDFARAQTSTGPHRDDFEFRSNDLLLSDFGSRGQQRTAIVAYRLAEAEGIRTRCREAPLLLLDDVMSELDETRRGTVVEAVQTLDQVIMTTTDWDHYPRRFLAQAACWKVRSGALQPT